MMWRNVAVSMLSFIMLNLLTILLPSIFAPVVSTAVAIFLYYQVVSSSYSKYETCAIVPYIYFFIAVAYTMVLIVINLLAIWGLLPIPDEMMFFECIYIPNLVLAPVSFLTVFVMYMQRHKLTLCINCKITHGSPLDRGNVGAIFSHESSFIMKNLMLMYIIIIAIDYSYYLTEFIDVSVTHRDMFVSVSYTHLTLPTT